MPSDHTKRKIASPLVFTQLLIGILLQQPAQAKALGAVASHHDHTEHYLRMPVHVITMTTDEAEYVEGLKMFEISFNRTRNIDTPMDMEVIQTTKEKFWELGWKSKLLYVLKSLRRVPHHQLVIWADSKDIVWLPCGRDMRQIFKEFDHDIVIGSCPFQYPDQFKEELFPDVPVMKPEIEFTEESNKTYYEYKYINAGFIMGRAGALIHYLGGSFLRYGAVDTVDYFNDQAFWANMYLAQFYDDAISASRHPSIAIDSGFMAVSQGAYNYDPVGDTGYWQSDKSRFTTCVAHASGGPDNYDPLFEFYNTSWANSFDWEAAQAEVAKAADIDSV